MMPMQDVADACRTGAATDIIFGLALGYKSAILPCFVIAICIYVSFSLANMYGIACAALGMLTTMSTGARLTFVPPLLGRSALECADTQFQTGAPAAEPGRRRQL